MCSCLNVDRYSSFLVINVSNVIPVSFEAESCLWNADLERVKWSKKTLLMVQIAFWLARDNQLELPY